MHDKYMRMLEAAPAPKLSVTMSAPEKIPRPEKDEGTATESIPAPWAACTQCTQVSSACVSDLLASLSHGSHFRL